MAAVLSPPLIIAIVVSALLPSLSRMTGVSLIVSIL